MDGRGPVNKSGCLALKSSARQTAKKTKLEKKLPLCWTCPFGQGCVVADAAMYSPGGVGTAREAQRFPHCDVMVEAFTLFPSQSRVLAATGTPGQSLSVFGTRTAQSSPVDHRCHSLSSRMLCRS